MSQKLLNLESAMVLTKMVQGIAKIFDEGLADSSQGRFSQKWADEVMNTEYVVIVIILGTKLGN